MADKFIPLQYAKVEFDENGVPFSPDFGDVYFSRESGLDETQHVFIQGNDLIERWSSLDASKPGHFVIAETGFGSGLNFLLTWLLWRQCAPRNWRLHYLSTEKYPMRKQDISRCVGLWPQLKAFSELLLADYPVATPGFHYLPLAENVNLTLIFDDATAGFKQVLATDAPGLCQQTRPLIIDAWFLDGFNPKANSALWQQGLFNCMAKLSNDNTTVATFSVSAMVKNGLKAAGFSLAKRPGFGRKREMLTARYVEPDLTIKKFRYASPHQTPWHIIDSQCSQAYNHKKVIIIGAGLAGCQVANAMAKRGWQVTVLEKNAHCASEASGNAQGVLYTKLSPFHSPLADFVLTSYLYASRFYPKLGASNLGELSGLVQLAHSAKEQKLHQDLQSLISAYPELVQLIDDKKASQLSGLTLEYSGLYWPDSGWLKPASICQHLLEHDNIQLITEAKVTSVEFNHNTWQCRFGDNEKSAAVVVIASGVGVNHLSYTSDLPLKPIKGQVSYWRGNQASRQLKRAICSDGYLLPFQEPCHSLGATYNLGKSLNHTVETNNLENLAKLAHFGLSGDGQEITGQRVSYRLATPDYLPLVGPVADNTAMVQRFAYFKKNGNAFIDKAGCYHPNLYMAAGFGSRALTYTPLCAEYLAALINREPLPISDIMARYLSPARFLIRDIARGKA